jgi:hypothetical protein
MRKVDLRKLLHRVEIAPVGSPELDSEFESTFRSVPSHVTRSIDAAARLIETELPGWWWNCGHCALRNGASLYLPGSSQIRVNYPSAGTGPDFGPRPEHLRLLHDPKWGKLFDSGFHCDRAGTVPLAMLAVFLEAKIALTLVQPEALANESNTFEQVEESEASHAVRSEPIPSKECMKARIGGRTTRFRNAFAIIFGQAE